LEVTITGQFLIAQRRVVDGGSGITTYLRLFGDFDLAARDPLRDTLLRAVNAGSPVVVDLGEVDFLDSEALGALVVGYRAAGAAGLDFHVVEARGGVRRVLEMTRLLDFK
jgi:anti-sigma B factor antagonist